MSDQWDRLIADGDWAVKEYWGDFNDGFLNVYQDVTPDRIRQFMAYLVRLIDGELSELRSAPDAAAQEEKE